MPIRRSELFTVAIVVVVLAALSATTSRACPVFETEPICADLDRNPDARLAAALASALDSRGESIAGRRLLESFLGEHPRDPEALHALVEYEWTSNRTARAHELAVRWRALAPGDPSALLHELVTAVTVESDPAVESRLIELARADDDAELLGAACRALSSPRAARCVGTLAEIVDWRREAPETRRSLTELLIWNGAAERARELLALETDPAVRRAGLSNVAQRFAYSGECEQALVTARSIPDPALERSLGAQFCRVPRAAREEFLAALESGPLERVTQLSWMLRLDQADPTLEALVRARLSSEVDGAPLWPILARLASFDPERHEQLLAEWADARPGDVEPWNDLTEIRLARGDVAGAAASLRVAFSRSTAGDRLGLVERWLDQEPWSEGPEIFDLLVDELAAGGAPAAPLAALAAAQLARSEGRLDEALALARSVNEGDNRWRAELLEMELLAALGTDDQLVQRFRAEFDGFGDAPAEGWQPWVAQMAANYGRLDLARERWLRALADDPGDPELHLALAELEMRAERPAAAIDALRVAIELRPELSYPRGMLATLFTGEQRFGEALDALTSHKGAEEELSGELVDLARAAREGGDRFAAEAALDPVLRWAPDALDVRFEQAALSATSGRRSAAREQFSAIRAELAAGSDDCVGDCDLGELLRQARAYLATGELSALHAIQDNPLDEAGYR